MTLPNELLILIVDHLRDEKIHFFDPVATKDLQSVRLICRRVGSLCRCIWHSTYAITVKMLTVATPLLFENLVYDLKFYREKEINRCVASTFQVLIISH